MGRRQPNRPNSPRKRDSDTTAQQVAQGEKPTSASAWRDREQSTPAHGLTRTRAPASPLAETEQRRTRGGRKPVDLRPIGGGRRWGGDAWAPLGQRTPEEGHGLASGVPWYRGHARPRLDGGATAALPGASAGEGPGEERGRDRGSGGGPARRSWW
jgi:hypothetical protein